MDNLRRYHIFIVNACPSCFQAKETVDHLLLNCKIVLSMWEAFLQAFGCRWVMLNRFFDLFLQWRWGASPGRGRIMWYCSFSAIIWSLWMEKNERCFGGRSSHLQALVDKPRFLVASWVLILPYFRGSSYDFILFNWKEVALDTRE